MSRSVPRSALWLAGRLVPAELAEDVAGEIEERWHADCRRSYMTAWFRAHRLAAAVAWHALRDRSHPLGDEPRTGGPSMLSAIARELAFAVRHWKGQPALALTAVLILSLGIGSTTAIFSIVDAMVLRDLPWYQPDRLINVYVARPHWRANPVLTQSWNTGNLSWPIFKNLQGKTRTLAGVAAWRSDRPALNDEHAELVQTHGVSASLLPLLGVSLNRGRLFTVDEDDVASNVAIVAYDTWQHRYGGRADILEQVISLNETRYRIVGVLSPGYRFGTLRPPEFLLPLGLSPVAQRTEVKHFLNVFARLAPGVTLEQAAAEAEPWVRGAEPAAEKTVRLVPLADDQAEPVKRPLLTLLAGAGLLLLIAASNVAALMQGTAVARRQELAIRSALGGSRRQVARQLFLEAAVLSAAAIFLGMVVAVSLTPALLALAPTGFMNADAVAIDLRVLGFAIALTLCTTILFGTGPAWSMAKADPADALRSGGRGSTRVWRSSRWIVAAQVGLALVLIVGAGLLSETVRRLSSQPVGFDHASLAVTSVRLPPIAGSTAEVRMRRTHAIVDRLSTLPGVEAASATTSAPFSGSMGSSSFQIPGRTFPRDPDANRHIVTERYFGTLGIRPIKGRLFDGSDQFGAHAAVVTDEFERTLMNGNGLSQRFVLNGDEHTIIGVIPAAKHRRYSDEPSVAFYMLSRQLPQWSMGTFLIRASGRPGDLLPSIRKAIADIEPQASFITVETMDAMLERSIGQERYRAQLAVIFGGAALMLAGIGLYGLLARFVRDQRREMGVRLALGAAPAQVRRHVMGKAFGLVVVGLVPGIPAALAAGQAIASFLYGVAPLSPGVLFVATAVVVAAALAAAFGPAIRAARIDPIEALRD